MCHYYECTEEWEAIKRKQMEEAVAETEDPPEAEEDPGDVVLPRPDV